MKKNSRLHLAIETEVFNILKKEAVQEGLTLSSLCRHKLRECSRITKIELMLELLCKKSNIQLNTQREVKMVKNQARMIDSARSGRYKKGMESLNIDFEEDQDFLDEDGKE